MFILMNTWMVGKNSTKHYYLTKEIFIVTMEHISDADYTHAKRVCEYFEKKTTTTKTTNKKTSNKRTNIGENRDLHVHSNILLLADVLEKFKNMCHKIY